MNKSRADITEKLFKNVIYFCFFAFGFGVCSVHAAGTVFSEGFEFGIGSWSADNGVWQVGISTAGPASCQSGMGTQCAGTNLGGDYFPDTDSRLISPAVVLPALLASEEIHLRFQNWFSYSVIDFGQVQVSVWDVATSAWGTWLDEGTAVENTSGWSIKDVDLTAYAGETVRIAFYHSALDNPGILGPDVSTGWYVDDVQIVSVTPTFSGDFEAGWGDWGTDQGVWQVGTPTSGPAACATGNQCAGTELAGNYDFNTDTRLVSATITLPTVFGNDEVHLRFQNWFSYSVIDFGQVQVSVWDVATSAWGTWLDEGTAVEDTSGWSIKDVDLTAYAGETVRIAFYHSALDNPGILGPDVSTGWYIDDISIVADTDGDFVLDTLDNCTLAANTNQRDSDGDGYGNACDGDLDNSGVANLSDFSLFRAVFGRTAPLSAAEQNADFNGDGLINLSDFSLFRAQFGKAPGPSCCGNTLP